jgi:hypothetical protein
MTFFLYSQRFVSFTKLRQHAVTPPEHYIEFYVTCIILIVIYPQVGRFRMKPDLKRKKVNRELKKFAVCHVSPFYAQMHSSLNYVT